MTRRKPKLPGVRVWTWRIPEGLCYFSFDTKRNMLADGKPSPEAVPVMCRLVPERELRKLVPA